MIQGLSTALSALNAANKRQNVTANNLANVNTGGFKAKITHLAEISRGGVKVAGVQTDTSKSYFINTGNPLDLAINGDGYFRLNSDNKEIFTRNGHFKKDADGNVVDSNGNILLENPRENLSVSENGDVFSNGNYAGKINIYDEYGEAIPDNNYEIMSGYLEASNVDIAKEIVDQIVNLRYFQANSETIRTKDEMLGNIVNLKT